MSDSADLRPVVRAILPFVVLAAGISVFMYLTATKPEPKKVERENLGALVEVEQAHLGSHEVKVLAQGKVVPSRSVVLQPEVAGRVVWLNDNLVPGGLVHAGDTLLRIDPRDYQLALQQQQAAVDSAQLALDVERSRKRVAEREWELLGDTGKTSDDSSGTLALREPQLRTAKVQVEAADSGARRAKLSVTRTVIKAPFNAIVAQEHVEQGQLVGPQSPLATLIGVDSVWVYVSVPLEQLRWLDIPGDTSNAVAADAGSRAVVWREVGGERQQYQGRVVRVLGDLDPVGGMARIVVEVPDPMGQKREDRVLPLFIGSFVQLELQVSNQLNAIAIPRKALRDGDKVYVMTADDTLAIREVAVAWRTADQVFITDGLADGERLVVSRLGDPVDGMRLRFSGDAGVTVNAERR